MTSKFLRKLLRRVQFASLVASSPGQSRALYQLIARPQSVDAQSLAGLSGARVLNRVKKSSLLLTGNVNAPLKVAENMYMNGEIEEALSLIRRTPGGGAQQLDGWLSLYRGDLARATDIFLAATDRQATKIDACRKLAMCYYVSGDLDRAVDMVTVGAAISPKTMPLMTLFSRLVRGREDIARYLQEKMRLAKNGFSISSAAQFVRACGRAGAIDEGEKAASAAVVNFCQKHQPSVSAGRDEATGLKKGAYSSKKGDLILDHVFEVARDSSVRLFPIGGTLLGLIRSQELLSWDKDLDFGCFEEEATLRDLWEIFSRNPYFVPMGTVEDRLIKLRHLSGVTVDVFVNFREGETRWHGGQFVLWRDRAFELTRVMIGGREFCVPDDTDRYLSNHYGVSWGTPDPHFDVFWEAPNAFGVKKEHRYINTVAKGLQFLAANSIDKLKIRLERAKESNVQDVVAGYDFVLERYNQFSIRGKSG